MKNIFTIVVAIFLFMALCILSLSLGSLSLVFSLKYGNWLMQILF